MAISPQRRDTRPRTALWARFLATVPNAKVKSTGDVYRRVGFENGTTLDALVQANVEFTYRYYARLARLMRAPTRARLCESVDPSGVDVLREAIARRRGAVLASAHLGDFDVVGAWLTAVMGYQVVVVTDPVAERSRQAFFDEVRRAAGLLLRRRQETRLRDLEADLRAGRIVLLMSERTARGPSVRGRLLGQPASLSLAPYVLARRTGCALIGGATTTRADGTRALHIGSDVPLEQFDGQPEAVMAELANAVSVGIEQAPWQWHIPANSKELCFDQENAVGLSPNVELPPVTAWAATSSGSQVNAAH